MSENTGPPEGMDQHETAQPAGDRPSQAQGTRATADTDAAPEAKPAAAPADATVGGASDAGAAVPEQADPADEPAAAEPDLVRDPLVEQIRGALGDAVQATVVSKGDLWVRVDRRAWRATAEYLKDSGFTYFCFLSGIDWMPNPELSNRYEQTFTPEQEAADEASLEMRAGVAGGETRFQVFARLYDIDRTLGITIKADLDDNSPSVDSIVSVYRGADWHERETWEMFGFDFVGHPGLRHLYLPTEFEGFPMRKDFPLLARAVKPWPGIVDKEPVPGEDDEAEVPA